MNQEASNVEAGRLLPAAHGWAAIETAPKDGTHVLLYYPEYHRKIWVGHYYSNESYSHGKLKSKSEGWHNGADTLFGIVKECQPTHWMALPLPPNAEVSDQRGAGSLH